MRQLQGSTMVTGFFFDNSIIPTYHIFNLIRKSLNSKKATFQESKTTFQIFRQPNSLFVKVLSPSYFTHFAKRRMEL